MSEILKRAAKDAASAIMLFKAKTNGRYYPGYHEDMRDVVRKAILAADVPADASLTAERDRLREALIASRNAHAELAEFLLGDGGSAVKSDVLKGMFADLQRARLAADAALEPRS